MKPFTQLTQAAPCVCHSRGYVIDAAGDFAPCAYCPAGETFAAELAAVKAEAAAPVAAPAPETTPAIAPAAVSPIGDTEAPDLAPVIVGPARVVRSVVRRQSAQVPGLVLERQGCVLTFRAGIAFITYDVSAGRPRVLDSMDGGYLRPTERRHIAATAAAYARKVAA